MRPDFLWPAASYKDRRLGFDIERFPVRIRMDANSLERAESTIQWMKQDAACNDERSSAHLRHGLGGSAEFLEDVQSHLRYCFYALVSWLAITYTHKRMDDQRWRPALVRFHHFKDLVEQHSLDWKSIGTYASAMGCTERSLTRSALDAEGISAKEYVLRRLGLEAKRLLIQAD